MKHLEKRNPNSDIFIVPQQEGGSEEDNYFGSIGDATMKHVDGLSGGERQLWEELIVMPSGAIFRTSPSFESNDTDPFNLKGKDLNKYVDEYKGKVSEKALTAIKEAIAVEQERREESEDALDRADTISFSDWENNPQLWKHLDIPSTPRDKFLFVGETNQAFYDTFPEGHPDSKFINSVILRCDREWCGSSDDEKYAAYLRQYINSANLKKHTKIILRDMVDALVGTTDSSNTIEKYLARIDNFFGSKYKEFAFKKSYSPIYSLFKTKEAQWETRFAEGQAVLNEVRKLGKALYEDKELRAQMTSVLWRHYEKLKIKFAPKLLVQGIDINRCSVQDLSKILNVSDLDARGLWFKRPFESIYEEELARHLNSAKRHHTDNETVNKILDGLEGRFHIALKKKNLEPLTAARVKMNKWQQENKFVLDPTEWNTLWNYYRILRDSAIKSLRGNFENDKGLQENV